MHVVMHFLHARLMREFNKFSMSMSINWTMLTADKSTKFLELVLDCYLEQHVQQCLGLSTN